MTDLARPSPRTFAHPAKLPQNAAPSTVKDAAEFVLSRYAKLATLDADEQALFRSIEGPIEYLGRGCDVQTEGQAAPSPKFLLSGWACRFRMLGDGRRTIFGFILPGDAIGVCKRHHPLSLTSIVTLSDCSFLAAGPVIGSGAHLGPYPNLLAALSIAESLDECSTLNQITRICRQTAFERIGHLLLELHWRLTQVGLVESSRFHLPLTQDCIGDATGLSVVHVNRTIQLLRRENLIEWRNHTVTLLEPALLAQRVEFRPPTPSDWRWPLHLVSSR